MMRLSPKTSTDIANEKEEQYDHSLGDEVDIDIGHAVLAELPKGLT